MTDRRRTTKQPEPRVLTRPEAIKALAHPARLSVLDALADGDELTATECAEAAGVSPSAMSYHLRALEKWGFVERAGSSGDGRERPWRSVPGGWRVDPSNDRAVDAATDAVLATMMDRVRGEFSRYAQREGAQPKEWQDASIIESRPVWLTADEAQELTRMYRDYLDDRRGRTARDHPEGARRARSLRVLIPLQLD